MGTLLEEEVLNIKTALAVDEVVFGAVVVGDVVVNDVAVGTESVSILEMKKIGKGFSTEKRFVPEISIQIDKKNDKLCF